MGGRVSVFRWNHGVGEFQCAAEADAFVEGVVFNKPFGLGVDDFSNGLAVDDFDSGGLAQGDGDDFGWAVFLLGLGCGFGLDGRFSSDEFADSLELAIGLVETEFQGSKTLVDGVAPAMSGQVGLLQRNFKSVEVVAQAIAAGFRVQQVGLECVERECHPGFRVRDGAFRRRLESGLCGCAGWEKIFLDFGNRGGLTAAVSFRQVAEGQGVAAGWGEAGCEVVLSKPHAVDEILKTRITTYRIE